MKKSKWLNQKTNHYGDVGQRMTRKDILSLYSTIVLLMITVISLISLINK